MRPFLSALYVAVHLAVLVPFVLGLAARYVPPTTAWWLQPIALVLSLLAICLAAATVIAVVSRRWLLVAFSAAALLAFAIRYIEGGSAGDGDGPSLSVATFNVGGVSSHLQFSDRGLYELLSEAAPDVVALQELAVDSDEQEARAHGEVDTSLSALGYEVIAPRPPEGHRRPPPVVSKLDLEESTVVGLSTGGRSGPAGTAIRAQFSWEGRSFVVYDVHLQSFARNRPWRRGDTFNPRAWIRFLRHSSVAFMQRQSEAEQIRRLLKQEQLPFLLCGDFNTTPHQWVYQELSQGLHDVYRASGGLWGPTFPSNLPIFRIDYILASEDWQVVEAFVGPNLPPDHRPVVARLRLREEEE